MQKPKNGLHCRQYDGQTGISAAGLMGQLLRRTQKLDDARQPVLLQGQYSYSVHLQQYYSAEYEYTIRPTIRPE